jgi:hypothetical protein
MTAPPPATTNAPQRDPPTASLSSIDTDDNSTDARCLAHETSHANETSPARVALSVGDDSSADETSSADEVSSPYEALSAGVAAPLLRAWRWWLPVALLSLALAILFADPFAGDWDALDYTVLALHGEPSTMLFGRTLFIFTNHLAYKLAHALFALQPERAYLLFKYLVVCEAPLAVVALWTLARDLTNSVRAATVAALVLALSPFYIIYSGQAMTEIPSLLLLSLALTTHLRGLRRRSAWLLLLGAALLGADNNVRETTALYGVWLVVAPLACGWKLERRALTVVALSCVVFFVCALAPFAYLYLGDVNNYQAGWHGWVESMRFEQSVHPVRVLNLAPLLFFFFVAAPLACVLLPAAMRAEWRARGFSPLVALACVGVFVNLLLVFNYSTIINARYVLTGLPGVAPLAADFLVRRAARREKSLRRGFRVAALVLVCVSLVCISAVLAATRQTFRTHAITKEYRARLALLPPDAVLMAGGQTVSVNYYRGVGLGRWDVIGTGGGFPGARLSKVIDEHLRAHRRVFIDTDTRLWFNDSWRGAETRALVALSWRFHFRRISDTIYEIRPTDDAAARDDPDLERLLRKPQTLIQRLGGKFRD